MSQNIYKLTLLNCCDDTRTNTKTPAKQKQATSDEEHYHPIMVELLRYQLFLASTVLFLQMWRTSLANIDHLKSWAAAIATSVRGGCRGDGGTAPASASAIVVLELLVRYMQLWAILCLGVYALSSVLYRVSTLGDRPDAASELTTEISLAKESLRAAGFAF
jgi:hypothetical protein